MQGMGKLKEVSKAKLVILEKYFPAWVRILGSAFPKLFYIDCFAGAGEYEDGEPGSPLIIFRKASELTPRYQLQLFFVERNAQRAEALKQSLKREQRRLRSTVSYEVIAGDAKDFVKYFLRNRSFASIPAFFFVDPYGHPLPIPLINEILERPRREVFLVLMWYLLNMHLNNPKMRSNINEMFGRSDWVHQPFMREHRYQRERAFLNYFAAQIQAPHVLSFRILFDPRDRIPGKEHRTKYYLMHFSNHVKAALLMRNVMWHLGDEEGTFAYSATGRQRLFSLRPGEEELKEALQDTFAGQSISFASIIEQTWYWPYLEKHYRKVLKEMESQGIIKIQRRESKRSGLKGKDLVIFPEKA